MRLEVTPQQAEAVPGQPVPLSITLTNTSSVIGGYVVRVLGADPGWVTLETENVSLFPDESRTLEASVTVPERILAGGRRIAIQVRELTPPEDSRVIDVDLTVPQLASTEVRVDPLTLTAGRRGSYSLIVHNTGNTPIDQTLSGDDAEAKVRFEFEPARVALPPGEHAVVDLRASARRKLIGSPAVRTLGIYLDNPDDPAPPRGSRDPSNALATATLVQRPVLARGALSLLGLLAAITVFGVVITLAMSRLAGQSAADRDLALQVAQARNSEATTGTGALAGTVTLLTSGQPVPAVAVAIYPADDTSTTIATTATGKDGTYTIGQLPAGKYKVAFRGAGFVELWYPGATTPDGATAVSLGEGQQRKGLNVTIGGVPATISGTVSGSDVAGATLQLRTVQSGNQKDGGAVIQTVPVAADGKFTLGNVPSPSVYQVVVSKPGYATSVQQVDVGAGENRSGIKVVLRKGDGLISGTVTSPAGPLGGVSLTATTRQGESSTVSLTQGDVGAFTLRRLATPAKFTLVASKPGYASQTLTLTLDAGQKLTGVSITLNRSAGALTGTVRLADGGDPAPGVSVTVTDGVLTVQTETESTAQSVGTWNVGGLPVPGTYTVTFSRPDLQPQTVSVSLDGTGHITPGSYGARISDSGIAVRMQSATAVLHGVIRQAQPAGSGRPPRPAGEATVTLTSGSATYTMTTASVPHAMAGSYRFQSLPPGTYTVSVSRFGTRPTSTILTLAAGQEREFSTVLAIPASITARVMGTDGTTPRAGWTVELYVADQFPKTPVDTTRTDSDGRFTFPVVDAPQAYVIVVRTTAHSGAAASITVQIKASEQLGSTHDTNPSYRDLTIKADPGD